MKTINIIMTTSCNAKCDFCFEHIKGAACGLKFTKDGLKATIDFFFNKWRGDTISIDFFGGEPTLCEDEIIYTIEYANSIKHQYNIECSFLMYTNAFIFPLKLVEYIKQNNIIFSMQISNEGFDNTAKDKGNLVLRERIYDNIKLYVDYGIPFIVRATMSSSNLTTAENLRDTVKIMHDMGIQSFYFFPIMEFEWTDEQFKIWEDGFNLITDYLLDVYTNNPEDRFIFQNYQHDPKDTTPRVCGAGLDYITVYPDGNVYVCQRHIPISTEGITPMGSIYTDVEFKHIGNLDAHEDCKVCPVKNCKICPIVSYHEENGRLTIPKTKYCTIRLIYWNCYMDFINRMKSAGLYHEPTGEQNEPLEYLSDILINLYTAFSITSYNSTMDFFFNNRLTFEDNLIYKLSMFLLELKSKFNLSYDFNYNEKDKTIILNYLTKTLETLLCRTLNINHNEFFDNYNDSLIRIYLLSEILLEDINEARR